MQHAARDLEPAPHAARELAGDWLRRSQSPTWRRRRSIRPRERRGPRGRTSCPGPRGSRGRSGSRRSCCACETVPIDAPHGRPLADDVVALDAGACPRSAAGASSASGSASSCRRRWARAARRSRPAGRRTTRRRRRRSRRSAWSAARPRSAGVELTPVGVVQEGSLPGFDRRSVCPLRRRTSARRSRRAAASRTENVFRSRLWRPQFLRVANSERGLIETILAWKRRVRAAPAARP